MKSNWKVVKVTIGERTFYRAVRLCGHNLVFKGGIWTTEAEAQIVATQLNIDERITDDVFVDADSVERLNKTADEVVEAFNDVKVEDKYINLTDMEVMGL